MKDFWAEELQSQRKGKLRKLAVFIGILTIFIILLILIIIYMFNLNFRRWCDENVLRKELLQEDTKTLKFMHMINIFVFLERKHLNFIIELEIKFLQ